MSMTNTPEPSADAVEVAAKAICKNDGFDWNAKDFNYTPEGQEPEQMRDYYRSAAKAALSASPAPSQSGLVEAFRPIEEWDCRDEPVLLLVDYRDGGEHPIEDAVVGLTIGHNNDHNVGPDEGEGWEFAGWCWSHDRYTQGRGKPIAWKPLTEYLSENGKDPKIVSTNDQTAPDGLVGELRALRQEFGIRFTGCFAENAQNTIAAAEAALTARDNTALLSDIRLDAGEIVGTTLCKGARELAQRIRDRIEQAIRQIEEKESGK